MRCASPFVQRLVLLLTFWMTGFALVAMIQTQRGLATARITGAMAEPAFAGGEVHLTLEVHCRLSAADLVLTGEGSLDSQSLHGKVVNGVRLASRPETDVIVIAGSVQLGPEELAGAGILAAHSIAQGPATLAELSQDTEELIARTSYSVVRTYLAHR
jgi:glycerate kinase